LTITGEGKREQNGFSPPYITGIKIIVLVNNIRAVIAKALTTASPPNNICGGNI